jgi:hypothetical protein
MPLYTKPSSLSLVWASGGAKIKPSDTKIGNGWIVELPPYETFNWWQNKVDGFIAHINQLGIPSWDSATEYQAGLSYVQESSGVVYRCTVTNTNKQPSTNPTFWSVAFDSFGSASAVQTALSAHLTNYSTLSGISNIATARNNIGVWSKAEADSRYAYKSGDATTVFRVANGVATNDAVNLSQLQAATRQATTGTIGVTRYATNAEVDAASAVDAALVPTSPILRKNQNLNDLGNKTTARTNLDVPSRSGSGASGTWGISVTGNSGTATKLATARTVALTGDVTGSESFDGSGNVNIPVTVNRKTEIVQRVSTTAVVRLTPVVNTEYEYAPFSYTITEGGSYSISVRMRTLIDTSSANGDNYCCIRLKVNDVIVDTDTHNIVGGITYNNVFDLSYCAQLVAGDVVKVFGIKTYSNGSGIIVNSDRHNGVTNDSGQNSTLTILRF